MSIWRPYWQTQPDGKAWSHSPSSSWHGCPDSLLGYLPSYDSKVLFMNLTHGKWLTLCYLDKCTEKLDTITYYFYIVGLTIAQQLTWYNMDSTIFLTGLMKEPGIHWEGLLVVQSILDWWLRRVQYIMFCMH